MGGGGGLAFFFSCIFRAGLEVSTFHALCVRAAKSLTKLQFTVSHRTGYN